MVWKKYCLIIKVNTTRRCGVFYFILTIVGNLPKVTARNEKVCYEMKNLQLVLFLTILFSVLVACSGKKASVVLEMDTDKYHSQVMYEAENDTILKQTTKNEVTYEVLQVNSKEEAEKAIQAAMDEFANMEGVTHKVQFEDDKLIEEIVIDYDVIDIDTVGQIPGLPSKNEKGEASLDATVELLESQGYILVE